MMSTIRMCVCVSCRRSQDVKEAAVEQGEVKYTIVH